MSYKKGVVVMDGGQGSPGVAWKVYAHDMTAMYTMYYNYRGIDKESASRASSGLLPHGIGSSAELVS